MNPVNPIRTTANRLFNVARYPVYFLQLFTGAKSFRDNPIIGSTRLNKLGLHVVRVVSAAAVTRVRYWCLSSFASKQQRLDYDREGFVLMENYLPAETFAALNEEVRNLHDVEVRQCVQGDALTQRVLLTDAVLANTPACRELLNTKSFVRSLKYASSRNSQPIYYVQKVKSNALDAVADPQRTLHSDTFHATMKAWLFLDDVGDHNGPFTYVPGSHKLSIKRLKWEYQKSIEGSAQENSYGSRGSLRVDEAELTDLGLPAPKAFKVPANTLVIANTNGFHRRGAANEVASRLEVWAYSRSNPFNPLPGFDLGWYNKLSHKAIDWYLKRQDRRAEQQGRNSSWHIVDSAEMFDYDETQKAGALAANDAVVAADQLKDTA